MIKQFNSYLNKYLSNLKSDKNQVLVFKGFSSTWLKQINVKKLFTTELETSLEELSQNKMGLITEAVNKLNMEPSLYWCTYEELLTMSANTLEAFCELHYLRNNLYNHYYPLTYQIPRLVYIYREYFDDIDKHSEIPDDIQYISNYYGNIIKIDTPDNYYVSYIDDPEFFDLFPVSQVTQTLPVVNKANNFIELSEDELPFLELITELEHNEYSSYSIAFTWKGQLELFSQNYLERINLLQELLPNLKYYQYQKQTETRDIPLEKDYEEILRNYWGYDHFRKLKMYKNVDDFDNPKEITSISQSQIINDLVEQSELAYKEEEFRDIFVTSPTGAGKSIMFQVPAIYLADKYRLLTIVISPLIGLMKDQVYGLQEKNVKFAATINSEISPVEKLNISKKIADGEISILYISPETLLSRSDIHMLIGDRKIGLFVIDEAHIVTTWGKAFRSDYWYLGGYLQKLRKEMKFPIATFTATAIYGGIEDMYSETRDSLLLINPISYFGYVKRDDIKVSLKSIQTQATRDHEYLAQKYALLHERLKRLFAKEKKVLVYFPFVSFIKQFEEYMRLHADSELAQSISVYYGSLKKEEKNDSFLRFKNDESKIMLATKAFGMGIDIPDISTVIHFAPTGNVCDYIQEIGRAARQLDQGKAYFDFLPKDFNHVKRLHGISTIRKSQLIQVMDKILMIYNKDPNKKQARNLLVSSEEFRYIFDRNQRSDNDDDLDNKLKTALLIIEKDFINRIGYSPIVARPRSVFSIEYVKVKREIEDEFAKKYQSYVNKVKTLSEDYFGGIYKINLKEIWEDHYKELSFPQFKYLFHQKDDSLNFKYIEFIEPVYMITMDTQKDKDYVFLNKALDIVTRIEKLFGSYIINQSFFTLDDLAKQIGMTFKKSKYEAESVANQLLQSIISYQRTVNFNRTQRLSIIKERETQKEIKYQVFPGLSEFTKFLNVHINKLFKLSQKSPADDIYELFILKADRFESEKTFIALGLFEMLDLMLFEVKGGDNPEIFIRVNSKFQIENTIRNAERYQNTILNNVHKRHHISVAMLTYLFENQVDTTEFWNKIEDYFLGKVPLEVMEKVDHR